MQEKQIRLVVNLHPKGGIVLSSTELDENPKSYQPGNATTVEYLLGAFVELGLKNEAEKLKVQKWPESVPVKMVFIVPETEEIMKRLGFREVGAIL
jgi:hypothetical protein